MSASKSNSAALADTGETGDEGDGPGPREVAPEPTTLRKVLRQVGLVGDPEENKENVENSSSAQPGPDVPDQGAQRPRGDSSAREEAARRRARAFRPDEPAKKKLLEALAAEGGDYVFCFLQDFLADYEDDPHPFEPGSVEPTREEIAEYRARRSLLRCFARDWPFAYADSGRGTGGN